MADVFSLSGSFVVAICGLVVTFAFALLFFFATKDPKAELAAAISAIFGAVWYLSGLREWVSATLGLLIQSALERAGAVWSVVMWGGGCFLAWYLLTRRKSS